MNGRFFLQTQTDHGPYNKYNFKMQYVNLLFSHQDELAFCGTEHVIR